LQSENIATVARHLDIFQIFTGFISFSSYDNNDAQNKQVSK